MSCKKLIFCIVLTTLSFIFLTGCCGLCISCSDGFKKGFTKSFKESWKNNYKQTEKTPIVLNNSKSLTKLSLEEINKNGVAPSTYVEVNGMPDYSDMVYTYYYEKDPNNITSVDNIYYPIMSKEQYGVYKRSLVKNSEGLYELNIEKAKSLGLKFRVFIRHKDSNMEFVKNSGEEQWTDYKGIAKSGKEIDTEAMDLLKTGEIGSLLHSNLIVIYME